MPNRKLKTHKLNGRLKRFSPNLNQDAFPTSKQITKLYRGKKYLRVVIEDPIYFNSISYRIPEQGAKDLAKVLDDHKQSRWKVGMKVQILYTIDSADIHWLHGGKVLKSSKPKIQEASSEIRPSSKATQSSAPATAQPSSHTAENSIRSSLQADRASFSVSATTALKNHRKNNLQLSKEAKSFTSSATSEAKAKYRRITSPSNASQASSASSVAMAKKRSASVSRSSAVKSKSASVASSASESASLSQSVSVLASNSKAKASSVAIARSTSASKASSAKSARSVSASISTSKSEARSASLANSAKVSSEQASSAKSSKAVARSVKSSQKATNVNDSIQASKSASASQSNSIYNQSVASESSAKDSSIKSLIAKRNALLKKRSIATSRFKKSSSIVDEGSKSLASNYQTTSNVTKSLEGAYDKLLHNKSNKSTHLNHAGLNKITKMEDWHGFFKQNESDAIDKIDQSIDGLLTNPAVTYPLSYNSVPNVHKIQQTASAQGMQSNPSNISILDNHWSAQNTSNVANHSESFNKADDMDKNKSKEIRHNKPTKHGTHKTEVSHTQHDVVHHTHTQSSTGFNYKAFEDSDDMATKLSSAKSNSGLAKSASRSSSSSSGSSHHNPHTTHTIDLSN